MDPSRRRVVIASNAAETSLTIDSLVHVVESGFIKQTQWDPILEQAPLLPIAHSQSGCRQRWGRVGRTSEGFAWSIYTKEQFERIFPRDTVPEIKRSCLDGVVLLSKRGGADRLKGDVFPWLDPPTDGEIDSSCRRLARQGAIDKDGDLTTAGADAAFSGGENALYARLVVDADRFGFGIEVATLLPFLMAGLRDLFPDDRDSEPEERRALRTAQDRLRNSCTDDLSLCMRVYQDWASLKELPKGVSWKVPAVYKKLRYLVRDGETGAAELQKELGTARMETKAHQIIKSYISKPAPLRSWIDNVIGTLRQTIRNDWARRNGIDASMLKAVADARADAIRQLGAKKKDLEDRDIDFAGLDRLRIIIGRAFPEHVYARSADFDAGGEPRYEPVRPETPDAPILGIGSSSSCRSQPPSTLIAIGPKQPMRMGNGEADERQLVLAPFVVSIDPTVLEATAELSDLALTDYFRDHLPRPAIGSEEDRIQKLHESLRRDFPPGMLVECRVQMPSDHEIAVEVVGSAGWGGIRVGSLAMSGDRYEKEVDSREQGFDFRYSSSSKGQQRAKVQSLGGELDDDVDDSIQTEIRWRLKASTEDREKGQGDTKGTPAASSVSGRLRQVGGQDKLKAGDMVVAEVTRHADLRARPGLILVTPPSRQRFRLFSDRYKEGDDVEVQVLGLSPKGSLVRGLFVREQSTGVETIIPLQELAPFSEPALLSLIPIGATFPVQVESIDSRQEDVQLTNLDKLGGREWQMLRFKDATAPATVARVDKDDRRVYVYVVLDQSVPDQGVVIPVKVVMYREIFEHNNQLRLPFKEGDSVHVKLRQNNDAASRTRVSNATKQESALLRKSGVTVEGGQLRTAGPMAMRTRAALLRGLSSPVFQDAVRELFLSSHELYGDRVVTDLERRFPAGEIVEGAVTWASGQGVKVALKDGVAGLVALGEITWWEKRPQAKTFAAVGDKCKAKVLQVDGARQLVHLSFRQLTEDPWKGGIRKIYPPTKRVEGIVRNTIAIGAFVNLEPGLDGMIHISKLSSGYVNRVTDVVQVGDRVLVRVDQINLRDKKLSLVLVKVLGRAPAETIKVGDQQPEPAAEFSSWDSPQWPWTDGENAITKREPTAPPQLPAPCKRIDLEKRSVPASWSLSWR